VHAMQLWLEHRAETCIVSLICTRHSIDAHQPTLTAVVVVYMLRKLYFSAALLLSHTVI
jgi:hypothetical protein